MHIRVIRVDVYSALGSTYICIRVDCICALGSPKYGCNFVDQNRPYEDKALKG